MEKKENCNKKCKLLRNFKKHVKNIFCNICTSVDKVSPFKSLTRLRDFSKKSREIFETFETFLFWIMRPTT